MAFVEEEQLGLFQKQKSDDWKWSLKDYPPKNGLKVFSCFSCGGSTMGYKLAGFECLGNVEIDPRMNEIYVANHHPKYNFNMDIRDFNAKEDIPEELYDLDVLDGSPPCTTFSMAGQREESWGVKKKFREGQKEQTLDDLSFVFIQTAKKLRPKVVVMENVEGLLLGEAWSYVQRIYAEFKDAGYKVKHWLCKGEKMGIPQQRHRVFFIAVRNDILFDLDGMYMDFDYEPVTYGEIKDGVEEYKNKNSKEYKALMQSIFPDDCIADVYERIGERRRAFTDKIAWERNVLCTLTGKGNILDGNDKAKISKMSVIHMQTFPEDFDFLSDSTRNVKYVCGMSVPPVMMKRIACKVRDEIFGGGKHE